MIRRILDPNPVTRATIAEIKANEWFRLGYVPSIPEDEEDDIFIDEEALSIYDEVKIEILLYIFGIPYAITSIFSCEKTKYLSFVVIMY